MQEWPSGSRHYNQNQKVFSWNPTRCSAGVKNPTSLQSFLRPSPNKGCFSCWWLLLGARKLAPKKLKNNLFQDRFYSLKAHAHYFTVFIYLATWRAAKFGIFTHMFTNLPRCSQSMNSLIYIYSIQIPSYFLWVFDHSHGHTVSCYCCPKKFLHYLLCDFRVKLVTMHCIGLVRLSPKFDVGQPISS